jgi:hypothetical protein
MLTCQICCAAYFPQSAAWEPAVCGECIASEVEMRLLDGLRLSVRKPAKRAFMRDARKPIEFDVQPLPRKLA